jgi:hypothetical protein
LACGGNTAKRERHRFGNRVGQSNASHHPKAPSPLRSAGALQNLAAIRIGPGKISIAGHIVAGTVTGIERKQLDAILAVLGK